MTNNIPLVSRESSSNQGFGNEDRSPTDEVTSPPAVCPESESKRSQPIFKDLTKSWAWECVAVMFGVLCMAAIAIIALKIDGIRLSQWHLALQPGTVISVLATACQSSLIFSVAEIIGFSKWFYFKTRSRCLKELDVFNLIAYAGASITIVALALGPFSQQIISLRDSQVLFAHANSAVFVTNTWDSGYPEQIMMALIIYDNISGDGALQGAFYRGIYASTNFTSAIDVTCQTGNCTWPVFAILGACSTCQDVTADSILVDSGYSVEIPGALGQNLGGPGPFLSGGHWKAFHCSFDFCIKRFSNFTVCNGIIQPYETQSMALQFAQTAPLDTDSVYSDSELWQYIPAETDVDWLNGTRPIPPFHDSTFSIMPSDVYSFGDLFNQPLQSDVLAGSRLAAGLRSRNQDWSHDEWEALYAGEYETIKQMNAVAATMDVSLCKAVGSGTALARHNLGAEKRQADRRTYRQEHERGTPPNLTLPSDEQRDSLAIISTLGPEIRIEATQASEKIDDVRPLLSRGSFDDQNEHRGLGLELSRFKVSIARKLALTSEQQVDGKA
ncbi:hypothetical protein J7T55_012372 [Diaporthe amygdali]|uniref:uncharacterized protein n=1 Tax=Phomopsis amygdali TaxID=1214568 RepID=UPI0022FEB3A7|nr:uncharacterized protein J7T55_012372 [Diaporthe amygdali]KAJ0123900.1 hypothetical protein J7T55_012372 [Diaporthe amygdali]